MPAFLGERGQNGAESRTANAIYVCGLYFHTQNLENTLHFTSVPDIITSYYLGMYLMLGQNIDSVTITQVPAVLFAVCALCLRQSGRYVLSQCCCDPAGLKAWRCPGRSGKRLWRKDGAGCGGILFPVPRLRVCITLSVPPRFDGDQATFRFWCEKLHRRRFSVFRHISAAFDRVSPEAGLCGFCL